MVVTLGELVGFAVPALVGILTRDASPLGQLILMPAVGLVEGAMLGLAQAMVLRRAWAAFPARRWVVATSVGAGVAWFLGMLPSTTHDAWSTWPTIGVAVTAATVGTALLASIGTAQVLVLPAGTRGRLAWVGWTALGWCAGLTAFSVVAPPLWQSGQPIWLLTVIGVAGGLAMAVTMAAVTGVGAVRLVDRARRGGSGEFTLGRHLLSTMLGTPVYDASGRRLGRVSDVAVDLANRPESPTVTHVVIGVGGGGRLVAPYPDLTRRPDGGLALEQEPQSMSQPMSESVPGAAALLLRRDVLDAPVVVVQPPRRTRVSDVVIELGREDACVVGLDLSPSGIARRLTRRAAADEETSPVPLGRVHLTSRHGHAAQLAVPGSTVLTLPAHGMAEVLTRVPVAHARDIVQAADRRVRDDAVRLLHPHVRARVTGSGGPPRRTRRFDGWRLHRPGRPPPGGDRG